MRHKFQCGHKGLGKFCHRCKQADTFQDFQAKDAAFRLSGEAPGELYYKKGEPRPPSKIVRSIPAPNGVALQNVTSPMTAQEIQAEVDRLRAVQTKPGGLQ